MKRNPFALFIILCSVSLLLFSSTLGGKSAVSKRSDIADRYKWNLTDIYPDWKTWEADLNKLQDLIDQFVALKGTLAQGPEQVLQAMRISDEMGRAIDHVYRYASLSLDLDQRNNDINANMQQVRITWSKFSTALSWFNPELLTLPKETMMAWMDQNKDLNLYRFALSDLYRQQEHVLDENGERLLSYFSRVSSTPDEVFNALSTADIKFPTITLPSGQEVQLTPATYQGLLSTDRDRADRQAAFKAHLATYADNANTYAAIYNSILQRDWAEAQARNYATTLDASLFGNSIPTSVYENLINTVKRGTAPLRRYYDLRKKALKLDAIDLYDGRIPLVDFDKKYEYDDAVKDVIEAVKPLGKTYQDRVSAGLNSRWVDVYESEGKTPGGYSSGVYRVHPYILMNYNNTIEEVFTLAHEIGHGLHSILSQETQPYVYSGYTLFVAEVASTMNEALLLDYLLDKSKDPKERIMLLQRSIDNILGTFFTQVLFADFELQMHRMVEQGEPITAEVLSKTYYDLLKAYYGDSAELDELYRLTWARIPHFYERPYYVYQYATSFAASAWLAQSVMSPDKQKRDAALDRFTTLLKSGGNNYPMEQLKKAGVDMSQPEVVQAVLDRTNDLVGRLEAELEKM
ncbi:MAG TPA: oligoendopeptidase F [bacterium]